MNKNGIFATYRQQQETTWIDKTNNFEIICNKVS